MPFPPVHLLSISYPGTNLSITISSPAAAPSRSFRAFPYSGEWYNSFAFATEWNCRLIGGFHPASPW